jgi:hypothetical protein
MRCALDPIRKASKPGFDRSGGEPDPKNMTYEEGLKIRQEVQVLTKELGDAVRGCKQKTGADAWFQNILLGLASECQLNAFEVLEGDSRRQITRVAWGARNLLELQLWTLWVVRSPQNARRFHEDMICDFREMIDQLNGAPNSAAAIKKAKGSINELLPLLKATNVNSKHLVIAEVAKELGGQKRFELVNKYLSKFVHPTSLSIHARLMPEMYDTASQMFIETAVDIIKSTFPVLTEALRAEFVPK